MLSHPEERSGALILRLSPLLGGGLGEFSDERRWSWWRCVARFYYFSLTPPPLLFVWPLELLVFGCRGKRAEGSLKENSCAQVDSLNRPGCVCFRRCCGSPFLLLLAVRAAG
ncbi:hypothetical protein GOODEAATRI_018671 [Goodea atripinnis]|uniref:Uncharacterized protein n=1 Tax=Goodea atripinnis TaxID=208336 RepID=A0ABV0N2U2_9TELE